MAIPEYELYGSTFDFTSLSVFSENKNGIYEGINEWFDAQKASSSIKTYDYKYIKPALQIKIKLPIYSHTAATVPFTYCRQALHPNYTVESGPVQEPLITRYYYYYVTNCEWRAKMTCELTLTLDTLTTLFRSETELWKGKGYSNLLSNESHITRKFKDRWKWDSTNGEGYAVIDKYAEGFGTLPMVRDVKEEILPTYATETGDFGHGHWYLVYMTEYYSEESLRNNPVSIKCMPEVSCAIDPGTSGPVDWPSGMFGTDVAYGILSSSLEEGESVTVSFSSGGSDINLTVKAGNEAQLEDKTNFGVFVLWDNTAKSFEIRLLWKEGTLSTGACTTYTASSAGVTWTACKKLYKQDYDLVNGLYNNSDVIARFLRQYRNDEPLEINAGSTSSILTDFSTWYDQYKTDGRLVKIREIPYPPFQPSYNVSSQKLTKVPDNWVYDPGDSTLKFTGKSFDCDTMVLHNNLSTSRKLAPGFKELTASEVTAFKPFDNAYETKMWNSQFYTNKVIYDANVHEFQLENWAQNETGGIQDWQLSCSILCYTSDGIDDGLLYQFVSQEQINTDFGEYMYVSKATDVPYYTNEYLNYVRYGKNIDERNAATTIAGSVASGLGSVGSTIASGAFAGGAIGAGLGGAGALIGMAAGAVVMAISVTSTCAKAYDSINSKIDQYTHQASTVNGTSDVSLFRRYGKNRLMHLIYVPQAEIKEAVANYFRLYGYACDEYALPVCTRKYVDYFKIDAVWKSLTTTEKSILDDAKARMAVGFRVFHPYNVINPDGSTGSLTWNTDLTFENWELGVWNAVNG